MVRKSIKKKANTGKRHSTRNPKKVKLLQRVGLSRLRAINFALLFAITGTLFLIFSQAAPVPGMYGSIEQDQINRINAARAANGKGALKHIECLNTIAEEWTKAMIGNLRHNPNISSQVGGQCAGSSNWTYIAENVGFGYSSESLFNAFMASSGHRANVLDGRSTRIGVGAYWSSNGQLWVTHVFAGCGSCTGAWDIAASLPNDPLVSPQYRRMYDYDNDNRANIAVYRPSDKNWYIHGYSTSNWGLSGDIPVPADYNGDGRTDVAMWRPSDGNWYVKGIFTTQWGHPSDIPVPGDYNGDGQANIAIYRPSDKHWHIHGVGAYNWGLPGDIPVPADYNGDGRTDVAMWRPSDGGWYIYGQPGPLYWGQPGDIPVPADYNGDGKTDIAIYRPSEKNWYIVGNSPVNWGLPGDIPVPADYNGDGKTDIAMWRPSDGNWYVKGISTTQWGHPSDIPLNLPYVVRSGFKF